jgi:DNA-binding CsgD family transcriptional regulator
VVARAHAACSGNPLALTELGRVLTEAQRRGSAPLPEPVPVGRHLTAALGARIAALPADVGRALVVLAACGEIDPDTLDEALAIIDGRLSIEQLETAEHAGLIQLTRGVVRFAHPLMRSVAFGLVSPAEQRAAHRAIAKVLDPTNDRRPWHLAEAAEGPDEEAEQELRSLAARCTASGAHHAAAIAAVRAADVATSTAAAVDLLLQAGESYRMLARTEAASPLFERAIALAVDPRQSWLVRQSRAHLWAWTESTERAVHELLAISRAAESADPAIAATTKMGAAVYASMMGDATRGAVLAREANELATAADDLTKFGVRSMGSFSLLVHGESQEAAPGLADLDLAAAMVTVDAPHVLLEIAQQAGFAQLMQERWAEAGATLSRVADAGHRSALETTASFAHSMLGEVALRTGRWTMARSEVMVGIVGDELNQGTVGMFGHATLARVEAGLGLTTEARTNAELALRQGQKTGMQMLEAWARHALGLVHLVEGDHTNALPQFEWIARLTRRAGYFDPGPLWWQGDYVEVLLDLGRQDDARRYLTSLESEATRHGRRFAQAVVARGRAVLDHDPAQAERSVTLLDALGAPFEAARSRLVWAGEASGTERRDLLLAALNQFESLGAEPWERRTRHALAAIGTNPPVSADPNIAALLTAAEARVALAACRGLTNQQVAQELYLGVKTVETHLSTVYRKLNVRSRTELAVLLANQP